MSSVFVFGICMNTHTGYGGRQNISWASRLNGTQQQGVAGALIWLASGLTLLGDARILLPVLT